jgi:ribosomal 50S subunit-recycling heat shock protein
VRLDKFLKDSRLIKRRTVAKQACIENRVTVNGRIAKPGTEVVEGDRIHITFGSNSISVKVKELLKSPTKDQAEDMYEMLKD